MKPPWSWPSCSPAAENRSTSPYRTSSTQRLTSTPAPAPAAPTATTRLPGGAGRATPTRRARRAAGRRPAGSGSARATGTTPGPRAPRRCRSGRRPARCRAGRRRAPDARPPGGVVPQPQHEQERPGDEDPEQGLGQRVAGVEGTARRHGDEGGRDEGGARAGPDPARDGGPHHDGERREQDVDDDGRVHEADGVVEHGPQRRDEQPPAGGVAAGVGRHDQLGPAAAAEEPGGHEVADLVLGLHGGHGVRRHRAVDRRGRRPARGPSATGRPSRRAVAPSGVAAGDGRTASDRPRPRPRRPSVRGPAGRRSSCPSPRIVAYRRPWGMTARLPSGHRPDTDRAVGGERSRRHEHADRSCTLVVVAPIAQSVERLHGKEKV